MGIEVGMGMGIGRKAVMRGRNLGVEVEIGMRWGTGFKEVGMTVGNGNKDSGNGVLAGGREQERILRMRIREVRMGILRIGMVAEK